MTGTLSWGEARRIALRAQGMGPARRTAMPSRSASREALERTVRRTHLLQIDSVSVFARAHHLPVFTRTGTWEPRALAEASAPGPHRLLRETLAHEAAYATEHVHRLLGFRRRRAASQEWGPIRRAAAESPRWLEQILAVIAEYGPISAAEVSRHLQDDARGRGWGWRRTESQWAVEYLFRSGRLDCVGRSVQFERLYVLEPGAEHCSTASADRNTASADRSTAAGSDDAAAIRELVALAARALGVADTASLADYFRLGVREVRPAVQDLLDAGSLHPVTVRLPEGPAPMLLSGDAPDPAPLRSAALVSPFDPLVFHRPRLQHLFDVLYRIGIYTPAHRRASGYYSLLFLLGDRFPARVDLRSDRARGVLQVKGAYREPLERLRTRARIEDDETVASALRGELRRAATWQGLQEIEVRPGPGSGDLSGALAAQNPSGG